MAVRHFISWILLVAAFNAPAMAHAAQAADPAGSDATTSDTIRIVLTVSYPEYLEYVPEVKYAKWAANASSVLRVQVDGQDLGAYTLGKTKAFKAPADSASFQLVTGEDDPPSPESNALDIKGAAVNGEVAIDCRPNFRILASQTWTCAIVLGEETVTLQTTDGAGSGDAMRIVLTVDYPEYLEYMPEVKYAKWAANASSMLRVHVDGQDLGAYRVGKTKTFRAPADSHTFQLATGEDETSAESNALNLSGAAIDGEVFIHCKPNFQILGSQTWNCAIVPSDEMVASGSALGEDAIRIAVSVTYPEYLEYMPQVKFAKWASNASSMFRVHVDGQDLGVYALGKTKMFKAPVDSASFQLVMGEDRPWPESNALDIAGAAIDGEVAIHCEPDMRILTSHAWACAIVGGDARAKG